MQQIPKTPSLPTKGDDKTLRGLGMWISRLTVAVWRNFSEVAYRLNGALPKDGTEAMTGALELRSYTVATLPAPGTADLVYVSDETGGATLAFYNGTNWKRVQDLVTVS